MVRPGDRVRDNISGFTGIATARYEYLYGCVRINVQAETTNDGKPLDGYVFDEDQLEVTDARAKIGIAPKSQATTGGPRSAQEMRAERR